MTKEKYTGSVNVKYELISGVGTITNDGTEISDNTYFTSSLGDAKFEFTPSELQDAEIKITVLLGNGEIVSKNVIVKVYKMTIEARKMSNPNNNKRYTYYFYVDGIAANLTNILLPLNSCMDIIIKTKVSWSCFSCGRSVKGNSHINNEGTSYIRPNNKLISYDWWANTTYQPTTETVNNCGNPRCSGGSNVRVVLNQNIGEISVRQPNTKFITFINIPIY